MLDFQQAAYLGIVQGLTEFFPVSSSGHLVIFQKLIPSFSQPGVLFDVFLHLGTAMAVVVYFNKKIFQYVMQNISMLIVASIPAVVVGGLFSDFLEKLFENITAVGVALLLTTVFNYLVGEFKKKEKLNHKKSFIIGCFQALAIVPGISRSGSTIFAGKMQGLNPQSAVKFSFILSVPAILGASFLQLIKYGIPSEVVFSSYLIGFLAAFSSGLFAIFTLVRILEKAKYHYFAIYTFLIALLTLAFL